MGNEKVEIQGSENKMNEGSPRRYGKDDINLVEYIGILRKAWWKIALFSLIVGFLTLIRMLQQPNIFQATAVITPAVDEKRPSSALGALASFGLYVGGPSKIEDLETLFKSNDLTVRVFKKYNPWPIIFGDKFDPSTGKVKIAWKERLFGMNKEMKPPSDWDAIRAAKDRLKVFVNKKANTLSISFLSPSAEGSATIVKYYLDEGKSRLQEEALDRAIRNNKFIAEQIGKTVDPLTRDNLYSLYGQEIEREMMARNREQFGFAVIDSPRMPDRKWGPHRATISMAVTLLTFLLTSLVVIWFPNNRWIKKIGGSFQENEGRNQK